LGWAFAIVKRLGENPGSQGRGAPQPPGRVHGFFSLRFRRGSIRYQGGRESSAAGALLMNAVSRAAVLVIRGRDRPCARPLGRLLKMRGVEGHHCCNTAAQAFESGQRGGPATRMYCLCDYKPTWLTGWYRDNQAPARRPFGRIVPAVVMTRRYPDRKRCSRFLRKVFSGPDPSPSRPMNLLEALRGQEKARVTTVNASFHERIILVRFGELRIKKALRELKIPEILRAGTALWPPHVPARTGFQRGGIGPGPRQMGSF